MHRRIHAIEGWGNPSCIRNIVEKTEKTNQKFRKISRIINQAPTPGPKHDIIQAQWALDIPLKNMLERV
jgi:hypothetical protein